MNLETLTNWLSEISPWVLSNSAGAVLLVLGIWLLRKYSVLRQRPRWLYALGLLVMLRALDPQPAWRILAVAQASRDGCACDGACCGGTRHAPAPHCCPCDPDIRARLKRNQGHGKS